MWAAERRSRGPPGVSLRESRCDGVQLASDGQAESPQGDDAHCGDERKNQAVFGQGLTSFVLHVDYRCRQGGANAAHHGFLLSPHFNLLTPVCQGTLSEVSP
jgi:hypothetical protein